MARNRCTVSYALGHHEIPGLLIEGIGRRLESQNALNIKYVTARGINNWNRDYIIK